MIEHNDEGRVGGAQTLQVISGGGDNLNYAVKNEGFIEGGIEWVGFKRFTGGKVKIYFFKVSW